MCHLGARTVAPAMLRTRDTAFKSFDQLRSSSRVTAKAIRSPPEMRTENRLWPIGA